MEDKAFHILLHPLCGRAEDLPTFAIDLDVRLAAKLFGEGYGGDVESSDVARWGWL